MNEVFKILIVHSITLVLFAIFNRGNKFQFPTKKVAGNNWTHQVKFGQQLDPPQKLELFFQGISCNFGFLYSEVDKNFIKYTLQHSPCKCLYLLLLTPIKQGLGNNWTRQSGAGNNWTRWEQYLPLIFRRVRTFYLDMVVQNLIGFNK